MAAAENENTICPEGPFKKREHHGCVCPEGTIFLSAGFGEVSCGKRGDSYNVCPAGFFKREGNLKNCRCAPKGTPLTHVEKGYVSCQPDRANRAICPEGRFDRGEHMNCRCEVDSKMRGTGEGKVYCARK